MQPPPPPPPLPEKKLNNLYLANNLNNGDFKEKSLGFDQDTSSMLPSFCPPRLPRRYSKRAVICLVGALCFILGLAIPFVFRHFGSGRTFGDFGRPLKSDGAPFSDDYKLDAVLSDLFISVKTTQKYHHPRLVILLETWVSLVKSQV